MKFLVDHDYHVHSKLSPCSGPFGQTTNQLLDYAVNNGIKKMVITDHFWDEAYPLFHPDYKGLNMELLESVLPLPQAEGVEFYFGAEIEMDKDMKLGVSPENMEKFEFMPVATSHMHHVGYAIYESDNTFERRVKIYIERMIKFLEMDLPFHKMGLAHFVDTGIGRGNKEELKIIDAVSDSTFYDIFKRAAQVNVGIEININIFSYDDREIETLLRPHRIAKDCGCKFYLGSDIHAERKMKIAKAQFEAVIDALDLTEEDKFRPLDNVKPRYAK